MEVAATLKALPLLGLSTWLLLKRGDVLMYPFPPAHTRTLALHKCRLARPGKDALHDLGERLDLIRLLDEAGDVGRRDAVSHVVLVVTT